MINILIIDNNPINIHNIIDVFINSNTEFCCNITNNKEKLIKIIFKENINYIFLNLDVQKNMNFDILEYIKSKKMTRYYNSIIISNQNAYTIEPKYKPYVLDAISENSILDVLQLNYFLNFKASSIKPSNLKKLIYSELRSLNYNLSYNGTRYIIDIIIELFYKNKVGSVNLEKEIYPILSKRYKKSIANIKSNISQANKIMYYDCKEEIIKEYFHSPNKPKTKEIVYVILDKVSQKIDVTTNNYMLKI